MTYWVSRIRHFLAGLWSPSATRETSSQSQSWTEDLTLPGDSGISLEELAPHSATASRGQSTIAIHEHCGTPHLSIWIQQEDVTTQRFIGEEDPTLYLHLWLEDASCPERAKKRHERIVIPPSVYRSEPGYKVG